MIKIRREENAGKGSFSIYEDDVFAGEMTYSWAGENSFIIEHTTVEEAFNGKGFGKQLLAEAVAFARELNVKVIPLCPFAKAMFDKDAGIQDVRK